MAKKKQKKQKRWLLVWYRKGPDEQPSASFPLKDGLTWEHDNRSLGTVTLKRDGEVVMIMTYISHVLVTHKAPDKY